MVSTQSFVFSYLQNNPIMAHYLSLGIINYSDTTSIGMLINQGQAVMQSNPHLLIYPSVYIATLMITFNLFGNGLRDAFNPSLRGVE